MKWPGEYWFTLIHHNSFVYKMFHLTHWGRVAHICVGNLTTIGPDNGLSPGRRNTIIWTHAGILLIGPWGTNFSEILIGIHIFSFNKIHLKMSSAKWRPFCLGLNVLNHHTNGGPLPRQWITHCHKTSNTENQVDLDILSISNLLIASSQQCLLTCQ